LRAEISRQEASSAELKEGLSATDRELEAVKIRRSELEAEVEQKQGVISRLEASYVELQNALNSANQKLENLEESKTNLETW
jgi:chromosome segregation ATPase